MQRPRNGYRFAECSYFSIHISFTGCKHVGDFQRPHPPRTQTKNRAEPRRLEPRSPQLPRRAHQTARTPKNTQRNRNTSRKKKNQNRLRHPHQGGPRTPKLILDSNIIIKLIINEGDLKQTKTEIQTALKKGYTLCTVDLALSECLNVIWKHAKLLHDIEDYNLVVQDLLTIYDTLTIIPARAVAEEAINIATTKNVSIYDALYIALAQQQNGTLYTADKKLAITAITITNTDLLKSN